MRLFDYKLVLAFPLILLAAQDRFEAGRKMFDERQYLPAAAAFEEAIAGEAEGGKRYGEIAFWIGQSYFLGARNAEAIPWLERSIAAGVSQQEAVYMLGNAAIRTRDADRARKAFARMFGVEEGSAAARLITAQFMVRLEFEEMATKELKEALALDARLPEAHYMLGVMATFRSELDLAITELKAEIELNPNFAMAYYKLGDAYSRREDWVLAIPLLQKAIWLSPTNSGPFILLGKGYLKRNELGNAEGILRRAIALDPLNYSAHYLLGQTLNQAGKTAEGKLMLEKSQQLRNVRP